MSITTDPSTKVGQVRHLLYDVDEDDVLFDDDEVEAYLKLGQQNVYRAASLGLLAIANNKALLSRWTLEGYPNEEATAAKELRTQAAEYEKLAKKQDALDDPIAVTEWSTTDFARRERRG